MNSRMITIGASVVGVVLAWLLMPDSDAVSPNERALQPPSTAIIASEPTVVAHGEEQQPTTKQATAVSPDAEQQEDKADLPFTAQLKQMENAFAAGDYREILAFHNIITLCKGVPKTAEQLHQWQLKHNDAEGLDIEMMTRQSAACQDVPELAYIQLEQLYRKAIKAGERRAKLALANLMPFDNAEKLQLLSESAAFSEQALEALAEKALKASAHLSAEERLFWLSLCKLCAGEGAFYYDEASAQSWQVVVNEVKAKLDSSEIETIEQRVDDWRAGNVGQRLSLIR